MKIKVLFQKINGRFNGLFFTKAVFKLIDKISGNAVFYRKYNEPGKPVVLPIQFMAGIGNRIKSMAARFAYYKTKEMYLAWPASGWVNKSFKDLFDLSAGGYKIKEINRRIPVIESDIVAQAEKQSGSVLIDAKAGVISIEKSKYEEVSDIVNKEYGDFFNSLKPSKKVLERINSVQLPEDFISVFVRENYDWAKFGRGNRLDEFIKALDDKSVSIYLSCMNLQTSKEFRKLYKGEVFELVGKDYSSDIDAVADLYILSKAKTAIYSYGSTFCEAAYYLSGCRQKVTIIGNRDKWIR